MRTLHLRGAGSTGIVQRTAQLLKQSTQSHRRKVGSMVKAEVDVSVRQGTSSQEFSINSPIS